MKWRGGSTCVPVWSPSETVDTFAVSPFVIRRSGVIVGPGSLFHVVMSGRITSETSCTRTLRGYCRCMITPAEVERIFRDAGALREGHFALSSGKHSPRYLEK